jgi:hypothetical protein
MKVAQIKLNEYQLALGKLSQCRMSPAVAVSVFKLYRDINRLNKDYINARNEVVTNCADKDDQGQPKMNGNIPIISDPEVQKELDVTMLQMDAEEVEIKTRGLTLDQVIASIKDPVAPVVLQILSYLIPNPSKTIAE